MAGTDWPNEILNTVCALKRLLSMSRRFLIKIW